MKNILILIIILSPSVLLAQHNTSISGFVYDKSTGEILIGATIYDKDLNSGAISNEYGYYSLSISEKDSIQLMASFLGYKPFYKVVGVDSKQQVNIYLETTDYSLNEVTISASKRENIVNKAETGVVRLQMKQIELLPNLFGEVDIIKAYQLTPGVQSGGEAKSDLYVRGGSPDQNLILLDDVPLYYVAHFGGFFSVFNSDAINDVKLVKGGFPARYGSRLSSILDVRMKEGNMKRLGAQGTIGLLSSKISIEGPIIKDRSSFIVSARKNILPLFKIFGTGMSYNFYDLNAKLNYRLSEKDKVFLSFYMGDDRLSLGQKQDITNHRNSISWGNKLISFRWNHVYNNRLFSNMTLSNTYFRNNNVFEYEVITNSFQRNLESSLLTGINDLGMKLDYTYLVNSKFRFRFGGKSTYHKFIPNDEKFYQTGTGIKTVSSSYSSVFKAIENALYLENEMRLNRVSTNIGIRFTSYHFGGNYHSFEPRFLINFIIREDLSLKYSFSKMDQYVHLLSYSGTGMPSDYWMPTNDYVKPETSIQNSIGLTRTFQDGRYECSIETYYKTLDNLIAFIPGESLSGNLQSWENVIEKGGKGTNYGIELFIQKIEGNTTGWIGATLAKAERTFENLNSSRPFPYKYDRLLDISIVLSQKLSENFNISATWTYGTGYPITLASEHYVIDDGDIFLYDGINSFKMRDYHRLDVGINFPKKTKWGERTWSFSVFNLYNRRNPYFYYYDRELINTSLNTGSGDWPQPVYDELKLYQKSLFGIFPSFSYSFTF